MKQFAYTCLPVLAAFGLGSASVLNDAIISGLSFGSSQRRLQDSHRESSFRLMSDHNSVKTNDDEPADFPAITLPYGVYNPIEATAESKELRFLHYKNIRYAQAPVGDLRFAPPVAPDAIDGDLPVFNGNDGHSCHQAAPQWLIDVLNKTGKDWEKQFRTETDGEDCLFLDVAMPMDAEPDDRFPVLVWIYGGGFVYGAKDMPIYNPAGFFRRSYDEWGDRLPFVFVALNYRMGAHGFLAGPKFTDQGGQPNLGLYDQRLALQWVQDNIEKFGGDPNQVTVMGESAGAGSIVHHLVWTGSGPAPNTPFKKAIIQSPAWLPAPGSQVGLAGQDTTYDRFLAQVNAIDLAASRGKTEEELRDASRELIREAPYGSFITGPVVDGSTIKDNPLTLFRNGEQDKSIEIFTGDVWAEGLPFVPIKEISFAPGWKDWTDADIIGYIKNALPLMDDSTIHDILDQYKVTDLKYLSYIGVSRQTQRWSDIVGQALVQCNARGISTAYGNNTYNYVFKMAKYNKLNLPLVHGQDVPYTFFNLPSKDLNNVVAENWQKYIMGFVLNGDPNLLKPKTNMVKYGAKAEVVKFDSRDFWSSSITKAKDPYMGVKCDELWPNIWEAYGADEEQEELERGELK